MPSGMNEQPTSRSEGAGDLFRRLPRDGEAPRARFALLSPEHVQPPSLGENGRREIWLWGLPNHDRFPNRIVAIPHLKSS
jgi:hypothetical protein